MDETFLAVLAHEGPVTIVALNAQPVHVVNTWASYITLVDDKQLVIPAGGMHSVEQDLVTDDHLLLTFGSKEVVGTVGPGAGFHVYGTGQFVTEGPVFEQKKAQFPWLSRVLIVTITEVQQKI